MFPVKKESGSGNPQQPVDNNGCVVGRGVNDGVIIPGQYIVAFKPASVSARSLSAQKMADISARTLQNHSIKTAALQLSFAGEPGGFVARLSEDEAQRLRADESVSIVEPDRIVALGACFTVVEPSPGHLEHQQSWLW